MSKIVQFFCAFMALSGSVVAKESYSDLNTDTDLICAVKNGDRKVVKRLLKSGVGVNQFGEDNKTALDVAVEYGNTKIALDLIKYDAKVTCKDNQQFLKIILKLKSEKIWELNRFLITIFPVLLCFLPILSASVVAGLLNSEIAGWIAIFAVGGLELAIFGGLLITLPVRAYLWDHKSKQNWMLPVSTIN